MSSMQKSGVSCMGRMAGTAKVPAVKTSRPSGGYSRTSPSRR